MYRPQGTYLVWVDFGGTGLTDKELYDKMLNEAKIAVDFGVWFGPGGEGLARFNVGCPRSFVEDAMKRLEAAFARCDRNRPFTGACPGPESPSPSENANPSFAPPP